MLHSDVERDALIEAIYEETGEIYCPYELDFEFILATLDQFASDWDWNSSIEQSIADGSYTSDWGDWDNEEYI